MLVLITIFFSLLIGFGIGHAVGWTKGYEAGIYCWENEEEREEDVFE